MPGSIQVSVLGLMDLSSPPPLSSLTLTVSMGKRKHQTVGVGELSLCLQNLLWRKPFDEVGSSINPDFVHNLDGYAHQDAQFIIYPVNNIVDKFEIQTIDKVEVRDRLVACEKQCIKRKGEVQTQTNKEMHDHERHNEKAVIPERRSDEVMLQQNFGSLPASPPFRGKLRETGPPATLEKNVHGVAPGSLPTTLGKSAHGRLSGAPLTPKMEVYPPRRRHRTGFPSHHAWKKRA
ncbi:hypothetical protein M5K25_012975 [Dendrobium thyrsiflorum]|uniref:Uncharacterized protein n=1 Tax=Dendrobium thyrsiflorum TaxID=117978 RepID=A0ABD0UZ29_DENTH